MGIFTRKTKIKNSEPQVLLREDIPFALQEAYRTLRTNIIFSMPEDQCKTIVVTSSIRGEGKSITAVNLAIALAKAGKKVLLIDCDLRLPTIASKLGLREKPGLTDYLYGETDESKLFQKIENLNLLVITAGTIPPNPSETLSSKKMQMMLEKLSKNFEYIVLDTPPVCTVTDATVLAKHASGVVLVTRQEMATYESVDQALSQLKFAGANIVGTVMTGSTSIKKAYFKYGSNYGYYGKK